MLIALFFSCLTLSGQQLVLQKKERLNNPYSLSEERELKSLYSLYSGKTDLSGELINGREYFPYYIHASTNPILFYGEKYSCSVLVNGYKYKDVFLEYDTYKDKVVFIDTSLRLKAEPLMFMCNTSATGGFELYRRNDTLNFVFMNQVVSPDFNLANGYYEVAYNGASKYLIRHISYTFEVKAVKEYNYSPEKYINTGNGFEMFKTKKQFIKLFGDKSGYVKEYINRNGINVRKAGKREIVSVLRYYDSLPLKRE